MYANAYSAGHGGFCGAFVGYPARRARRLASRGVDNLDLENLRAVLVAAVADITRLWWILIIPRDHFLDRELIPTNATLFIIYCHLSPPE
jgi:hypothetical protein